MGSRLDDELDQILKNTSFESGNELDQTGHDRIEIKFFSGHGHIAFYEHGG